MSAFLPIPPFRASLFALASAAALFSAAPAAAAGFRYWDVRDTNAIPKTLSATGLYVDIAAAKKSLVANAWHFEVNSPLWSDDAKKKRWVLLKPGKAIRFEALEDYWGYPDSAVFVKQFAIDTVPGDSSSRVLWETRLLVNSREIADSTTGEIRDNWYGYSYKWDADQKEARLVPSKGLKDSIRVYPYGSANPYRVKKWAFPSQRDCAECHVRDRLGEKPTRSILGFFTAQLNRPHPDSVRVNQLEYFFAKQVLSGTKPVDWSALPRWRPIEDNTASLDVRARSYIAANCSGCHGTRGLMANAAPHSTLNYDFHAMKPEMEFRHLPVKRFDLDSLEPKFYAKEDFVNNPKGYVNLPVEPALVVAGVPQKSVILYRQTVRNTAPSDYIRNDDQMPPLATYEVNKAATDLIAAWIRAMPGLVAPTPSTFPESLLTTPVARIPASAPAASLRGRLLTLSPETARSRVAVAMSGIDGRTVKLDRVGEGIYAVPGSLPKGLYFIRIGSATLLRHLL